MKKPRRAAEPEAEQEDPTILVMGLLADIDDAEAAFKAAPDYDTAAALDAVKRARIAAINDARAAIKIVSSG